MKNFLLSFLLTLATISAFSGNGWRKGEKEVRVFIPSHEAAAKLHSLNLNGDFYGNSARLYVIPEELQKLQATGLDYEILIDDLNDHYRNFWNTREAYHSYQEIIDLMDSLVGAFPEICAKTIYGTSPEGRELSALKISDNVESDEPEAEVFFDGGIHGDEIGGPENMIRFARDLCLAYNDDPEITDLIDDREIWLYIMVNPDGRENTSRYNSNGIDLNRDCGYMWDGEGNSYGAFSQVESKKLRDCIYGHQFVIHTTYHSGTEYISYPWSYRSQPAPDKDHIDFLAELYSTTSTYPSLEYGQGNTGMYPINGSTKDFNYGAMGSVSWSMEISYSKQPPASQIMMYYNHNKPAMLKMIEYAGYGIKGHVTDAATGHPVEANVFIDDGMPVFSNENHGDYHKYVVEGTYNIKVIANGYVSKSILNVTVPTNSSIITKDIQLEADPSHHASRIVSCRIPGNNEGDEGKVTAALGPPDNINYSIGNNGWVVLDVQTPVVSSPGNDIIIYEGDDTPEGYTLYASNSKEGPWTDLGSAEGTAEFDMTGVPFGQARYLKIQDDGGGTSYGNDVGFDLDAIEVINAPVLEFTDHYVVDTIGGNGDNQINPGETFRIVVEIHNSGINSAQFAHCTLSGNNDEISLLDPDTTIQFIGSNDTAYAIFEAVASETIEPGTEAGFDLFLNSNNGHYENTDAFSFEVGVHVDISEGRSGDHLQIFPMPFGDILDIKMQDTYSEILVRIFDLTGKKLAEFEFGPQAENPRTIHLSGLNKLLPKTGIYLLQIKSENIQSTQKIIRK